MKVIQGKDKKYTLNKSSIVKGFYTLNLGGNYFGVIKKDRHGWKSEVYRRKGNKNSAYDVYEPEWDRTINQAAETLLYWWEDLGYGKTLT